MSSCISKVSKLNPSSISGKIIDGNLTASGKFEVRGTEVVSTNSLPKTGEKFETEIRKTFLSKKEAYEYKNK